MKKKYHKYLQQYVASSISLNMEFSEFLASKLEISEVKALRIISKYKNKVYETTDW